ncbi:unnamed protein product, partial [Rotaria sordida]
MAGPTGCGKSTLLDILAGRKDSHGLTGNVLVSGKSRPASFKDTVGYVIQDGTRYQFVCYIDMTFLFFSPPDTPLI